MPFFMSIHGGYLHQSAKTREAGHGIHSNYKRTTYEYETERITLKHQQNMCTRSLPVEIEMMPIEQDFSKND